MPPSELTRPFLGPGSASTRSPQTRWAKNQTHLDLVTGDLVTGVRRLTGLGPTKRSKTYADIHYVALADPEDNEVDLIAR